METIHPTSWTELTDVLYAGSWREDLARHRSPFAYRGMGDASHDLSTTLRRLGHDACRLERHILRNFRKYAGREEVPDDSPWNWLAVAQHHGLPTRLLDWTYSPYVALHFATEWIEDFGRDGVVWCIDYPRANELLPTRLRSLLHEEGADTFTAEMLGSAASTLRELDAMGDEPFLLFFEPPSLDERIVNQFALFSFLSDPLVSLDDWIIDHPELARRVIVPAGLKWEIRDKLDQANVTERVLFPGLDGLGRWLTRYYTPRATGATGWNAGGKQRVERRAGTLPDTE